MSRDKSEPSSEAHATCSMRWRSRWAAIAALAERRAHPPKRVMMDTLPAGSPMTYYCRECGAISDVLPEAHHEKPKRICGDCAAIVENGWLSSPFPKAEAAPRDMTAEEAEAEARAGIMQTKRLVAYLFAEHVDAALRGIRDELSVEPKEPEARRYFRSGYQHGIAEAREAVLRIRDEFCSGSGES